MSGRLIVDRRCLGLAHILDIGVWCRGWNIELNLTMTNRRNDKGVETGRGKGWKTWRHGILTEEKAGSCLDNFWLMVEG